MKIFTQNKNGIVIVDKPAGITSHDVVSFVRRRFQMKKVGHAGTLDPLATGVLVVLLGPSTRLFDKFVAFDKAYNATLKLGTTTTTADIEGKVIRELPFAAIGQSEVEVAFRGFVGNIKQKPPMVSAVKHNGQRLYKLARKGIEVDRQARDIKVSLLKVLSFSLPYVKFCLECSKGTYVRKLAEDIGQVLGCGACISQIERTKVGPFSIDESISLEELNESHIRSWPG